MPNSKYIGVIARACAGLLIKKDKDTSGVAENVCIFKTPCLGILTINNNEEYCSRKLCTMEAADESPTSTHAAQLTGIYHAYDVTWDPETHVHDVGLMFSVKNEVEGHDALRHFLKMSDEPISRFAVLHRISPRKYRIVEVDINDGWWEARIKREEIPNFS